MPLRPTIHTDQLLSNVSVQYRNEEYIADRVFPPVDVKKQTDQYRIYTRNFRIPETKKGNKARARIHEFEVTYGSYILEDHALKDIVTDADADNYDIFDLKVDTVEELTDTIKRRIEKSVADLFTTTNWSLNVSLAAAATFNTNTVTSNPIPLFDTGTTEIINNSGRRPNFAIIPRTSFVAIKNHVSVLDRVKYTSMDVDESKIASLLGIPELLIPTAQYDASHPGVADDIGGIFAQDICFLGYKPAKASPKAPSSGYIFKRNKPMVRRWRDEELEGEWIEVGLNFQPKVVASLTGFLIKDTLA